MNYNEEIEKVIQDLEEVKDKIEKLKHLAIPNKKNDLAQSNILLELGYYTKKEAMEELGVKNTKFWQFEKEGLEVFRLSARKVFIHKDALRKFIESKVTLNKK